MLTREDIFNIRIDKFKNAKQEKDKEIAGLKSLGLVGDELESKKREIVDAFLQRTRELRSDPRYQDAMMFRHSLKMAEKEYFALKKEYEKKIVDSFEKGEKIEEEAIGGESETLFKGREKTEVEKKIQNTEENPANKLEEEEISEIPEIEEIGQENKTEEPDLEGTIQEGNQELQEDTEIQDPFDDENIEEEIPDEIMGDEDKIIAYIKNRFIDIEENINYMGFNGKKIHLNLPVIGDFEGFKFNAFVSSSSMSKADFDLNQNLEEKSYSKDEICGLLSAINKFMATCGVCTDGDMNYKNQLKYRKTGINKCKAGDCLKNMLDLSRTYFLNGKNVSGRRKSSRAIRHCLSDRCYINRYNWDKNCAYLLLKSDN